jgi:hypothetical protein
MNIQWTYNDFRTKGPIIRNVQSWEIADAVNLNRGTYRDTWPMLPFKMGTPNTDGSESISGQIMPDDGQTTPAAAGETQADYPRVGLLDAVLWTDTRVGKVRVPDELMHVAPRTRYEEVVYLKFYDGAFVGGTTATDANIGVTSDNTTDILTKTAHSYKTGDIVQFVEGTNWDALTVGNLYFVIKLSANTFMLATTLANALALTQVNLTGTNGTAGVFLLMTEASQPSGNVVGFVQLSEIVSWNAV